MSTLDISRVLCYPSKFESGSTIGFGMITFQDVITVKFNIIKAKSGDMFVSWPQKKKSDGEEWNPQITFEDKEAREDIQNHIIAEFNKSLGLKQGGTSQKSEKRTSIVVASDDSGSDQESNSSDEKMESKPKSTVKWGGRKK